MNILISIKSLFSPEGAKAARAEMQGLSQEAANAAANATQAGRADLGKLSTTTAGVSKEVDTLNKQLRGTNSALHATQALARGDVFGALNQSAAALSEKLGNLGKQFGAAFAGFGIGWQIGTLIRDLTGLGKALDNLVVPPTVAAKSIRDLANERLAGLRAELEATQKRMDGLAKSADAAADRVRVAIEARIAKREQTGAQAEAAAPEEDKPIVAAQTRLDVSKEELEIARKRTEENRKAAQETQDTINAEHAAMIAANQELEKRQEIYNRAKQQGSVPDELTVDVVAAQQKIEAIRKAIEGLRETAAKQEIEIQVSDTALTKAQTAVTKAQTAVKEATQRKADDAAKAESARKAREQEDQQKAAEQQQRDAQRREADARKLAVESARRERQGALGQAQQLEDQAAARRKESEATAERAASFRASALDPRARRAAMRAEESEDKAAEREQKRFSSLLDQAKKAGYRAVAGPDGQITAARDERIMGRQSQRLADAVVAAAEQAKAEQNRREADQMDKAAKEAQVKAARLLETIAKNTEQGPVA